MLTSLVVIIGLSLAAGLGGWFYLSYCRVTRPPIGVFNYYDLAVLAIFIIVTPYLYLILPSWIAGGLLVLSGGSILYLTLEGMLPGMRRGLVTSLVLVLLFLDIQTSLLSGLEINLKYGINNLVLLLIVIGLANLWVQTGMRAAHAVLLGAFLTGYDFVATSLNSVTGNLFEKLAGLPLSPLFGWASGKAVITLGMGDLLLATVFPLVMRKAYRGWAGLSAFGINQLAIGVLLVLPLQGVFPVMVVLGPLMLIQYFWWHSRAIKKKPYAKSKVMTLS
ncbi:MAG TPA: hypothetical protein VH186_34125 [Chloroflexia bacterium]|nr:hypothetical protein [Chloroflexia bacterium]